MISAPILKKRYTAIVANRLKETNIKVQEKNEVVNNETAADEDAFQPELASPTTLMPASSSIEIRDGIMRRHLNT